MHVTIDSTLAEIATRIPGAVPVLERHRLDFCCHGDRTLGDACADRHVDAAVVAAEIAAARGPAGAVRWDEAPLEALVEHIVGRYHARLRVDVPSLVALATKVERVHGEKPTCPLGLAEHLRAMETAIAEHLAKEEQIVFPMLLAGLGPHAHMPIRMMLQEHDDHAAALARTRALTGDLTPPTEACVTWQALYVGLADLEAELHAHIHLENHVLFARALRELPEELDR
jgi:regulator of cell morphogenesis and NO signaling